MEEQIIQRNSSKLEQNFESLCNLNEEMINQLSYMINDNAKYQSIYNDIIKTSDNFHLKSTENILPSNINKKLSKNDIQDKRNAVVNLSRQTNKAVKEALMIERRKLQANFLSVNIENEEQRDIVDDLMEEIKEQKEFIKMLDEEILNKSDFIVYFENQVTQLKSQNPY